MDGDKLNVLSRRLACLFIMAATVASAAGCADGNDQKAGGSSASAKAQLREFYAVNQLQNPVGVTPEVVEAAPKVGTCVNLADGRNSGAGLLAEVDCAKASFKIVQIADLPNSCVADSDERYFKGIAKDNISYALCLDINWRPDSCVEMKSDARPKVVECANRKDVFRATRVLSNTIEPAACGADSAVIHPNRRFAVCVAELPAA